MVGVQPRWKRTPRERIEAACADLGRDDVVAGCLDLLAGREVAASLIQTLGGHAGDRTIESSPSQRYWLRVWATRGLLWAWDDSIAQWATPSLLAALADDAWRVREMAAKVVARHLVADAFPVVVGLRADPVPRVRASAARAVVRLTEAGA